MQCCRMQVSDAEETGMSPLAADAPAIQTVQSAAVQKPEAGMQSTDAGSLRP